MVSPLLSERSVDGSRLGRSLDAALRAIGEPRWAPRRSTYNSLGASELRARPARAALACAFQGTLMPLMKRSYETVACFGSAPASVQPMPFSMTELLRRHLT